MMSLRAARGLTAIVLALVMTLTGCAFQGLNSLPLPGCRRRGPGAVLYHVEIPNIGALESNSPVMIDDVIIGSVGKMTVSNWHADVEVSVRPDVVVPSNAVVTVGQTSLLGSMHMALDPPLGEAPIRSASTRCHHPADEGVGVPLDGADAGVVVGGRERGWPGTAGRHRAQLQHCIVGT